MSYSNSKEACSHFIKHGLIQHEANLSGDYEKGNQAYTEIKKALSYLWHNDPFTVSGFLSHQNINMRLWAATFWLEINAEHAIKILEAIKNREQLYSTDAKYTLLEWEEGNISSDQWSK